jgi:hypothetical protein
MSAIKKKRKKENDRVGKRRGDGTDRPYMRAVDTVRRQMVQREDT